jgi:hypothetical protein
MWQNIDLRSLVAPILIDSHTVYFKLSAWVGGWLRQDDIALVTLSFFNGTNEAMSTNAVLQPVFAIDRNYTTSLIYRDSSGMLPIGTRSLQMQVAIIRAGSGPSNDGYIDNIALILYQ